MSKDREQENGRDDLSFAYNTLRFSWHVDGLVAGSARPGRYGDLRSDFEKLKQEGISVIINLCAEPLSIPEDMAGCFDEVHEPILDGHPPEPEQLEDIIRLVREARESGKRTLIHCRGGVGRTATVLIPVIMKLESVSLDDAVQRLRKSGRYTQTMQQWEFLQSWVKQTSDE